MPVKFICILSLMLSLLFISACSTQEQARAIVQVDTQPIYITATPQPTGIPTYEYLTATNTPLPSATPIPTIPTVEINQKVCDSILASSFAAASDACIQGPDGFFCNGSNAIQADPNGPAQSLALRGAMVEATLLDRVKTAPYMQGGEAGIAWMRLEEPALDALLLGDVEVIDRSEQSNWLSFTVETQTKPFEACPNLPISAMILQAPYGQPIRLIVNGTSVELNGTMIIYTEQQESHFISLEGLSRITVLGQIFALQVGQQLDVAYGEDWTVPASILNNVRPLDFAPIANLPIMLLDRPALIPQPGYAQTEGLVNMRAEPALSGQLLFQVPKGQIITILGKNPTNDWYHIRLGNGDTGWMKADLLARYIGTINETYEATPTPPRRYGTTKDIGTVIVKTGGNVRTSPDVFFPATATIPFGEEVEILSRSPYSPWVEVSWGETKGWMSLITLETKSVIGFLPMNYEVEYPPIPTGQPIFEYGGGHAYPDPASGY